jgi:hypothetical protein
MCGCERDQEVSAKNAALYAELTNDALRTSQKEALLTTPDGAAKDYSAEAYCRGKLANFTLQTSQKEALLTALDDIAKAYMRRVCVYSENRHMLYALETTVDSAFNKAYKLVMSLQDELQTGELK